MNKSAVQEGVILIIEDDEPVAMVRANGHVTYFKLEPMSFQDHISLLNADQVQK